MKKTIKAWAGLVRNSDLEKWRLCLCDLPDSDILSIFKTKKGAKKTFSKVIPCEIKILTSKSK